MKEGTVILESSERTYSMKSSYTHDGLEVPYPDKNQHTTCRQKTKILSVVGGVITKVEIEYLEYKPEPAESKAPEINRSYIV